MDDDYILKALAKRELITRYLKKSRELERRVQSMSLEELLEIVANDLDDEDKERLVTS